MRKPLLMTGFGLLAPLLFGMTVQAAPVLQLKISDTYAAGKSVQNGTLLFGDPVNTGQVYYSGAGPATAKGASPFFGLSITAQGDPLLTTADGYSVDLGGVFSSRGAGSITFALSQTGLTLPYSHVSFLLSLGGTMTKIWTVKYDAYADAADTAFGTGLHLGTDSFTSSASVHAFAFDGSASETVNGPYSISEFVTFTTPIAGFGSFDASVMDLPEPSALAMLATGMFGAGLFRRRR